jgi:adhesin/invasin
MLTNRFRCRVRLVGAAAFALLGACQDEVPPPSALTAVGETAFSGTVAEPLGSAVTVKVTDAKGTSLGGIPVTFTVAEGGGAVAKAVDTTTSAGTASARWTLGERAGAQRLVASVAGVTGQVSFTATARPGAPAAMAANGGNQQSVVVGTAALTAPSVIIRDRFANPVPGVSVLFTVGTGGGTLTGNAATTNSAGVAAVGEWKMGTMVGTNTLSALALAGGITGNPVTFTATATPGAAASVSAPGGTSLTGTVFRAVTPVPQVRVTDAGGNAVSGVAVAFTGSAGSTVVGATKTTDAAGVAAPDGWVLGTAVGNYTLTAAVSGAPSLVITASARADAASTMTIVAGNNQTAQAGRTVAIEPTVRVADQHGNPVSGVEVLFEVGSGGGTAVGRRATTGVQGTATVGGWTLGDVAGTNTLVASVATTGVAVAPVTFTASATAGAAATMAASAGQNQTAQAGSAVATRPSVVIRDARGNPKSGERVTFSVGTGGGVVTGASDTSNASGVVVVGSWTLGAGVGTQTLVARSGTLPEVTFTATATAGAASRLTPWSAQSQSGIVAGSSLTASQRPAVRVTDSDGNPVQGATVTFRTAGDGSSGYLGANSDTVATVATNVNGIATVGTWALPVLVGTSTVTARVAGVSDPVTFTVSSVAGAAAALTPQVSLSLGNIVIGGSAAGASLPSVRLTDANGNPLVGATVTFTAFGATGAITGGVATTNAGGVATLGSWAMSATVIGSATVVATYADLTQSFTANVIASAAQSTMASAAANVALNGTTTITVTLRTGTGAVITSYTAATVPTSVLSAGVTAGTATAGSLGAFACTNGVCTATFTAPNAAGTNSVAVTIGGTAISGSPITITMP